MTYRINLFNNNYIILTTTTIIKKHQEHLNKNNQNSIIWHNLYNALKAKNILAISSIALDKNTLESQTIMNELTEEAATITMEDIKNACIIAAYKGDKEASHLATIIITNLHLKTLGTVKEIKQYCGEDITNYIINNNSIQNYYKNKNGISPYEYDRYVFLYKNNVLEETLLPEQKENKIKKRVKNNEL